MSDSGEAARRLTPSACLALMNNKIFYTGAYHNILDYMDALEFNAIMEGPKNIHVLESVINRLKHNRLVIEAPHWSQKNHIASYLTI